MAKTTQKGYCYLCGAEMTAAGMRTHLVKTHGMEAGGQLCRLLKVEGRYNKNYWLYLDMPVDSTLKPLDDFLRKIWLECCGHMSAFSVGVYDYEEIGKSRKISAFDDGFKLKYEYDFGSTTDLRITFLGEIRRPAQRSRVRLLARNKPFEYTCCKCGQPATYIDSEAVYSSDNPFYCEDCAEEIEFTLPVTNSPRMGVCCYEGDSDIFTFDPAAFAKQ